MSRDDLPYIEYPEESGELKRLYADVQKSEEINLPAEVSEHPVETGAKVADHYRKTSETVTVRLFFSNSPIQSDLTDNVGRRRTFELNVPKPPARPLLSTGAIVGAATGIVGLSGRTPTPSGNPLQAIAGTGLSLGAALLGRKGQPNNRIEALAFDRPFDRLGDALALVRDLQRRGELITVRTTVDLFENAAIINATFSRDETTGDGGWLELTLKEVRFATADVTFAIPIPAEPRGQTKKHNGKASKGTPVDGPQAGAVKDVLNKTGVTKAGSGL